jgi:hypothetical protein
MAREAGGDDTCRRGALHAHSVIEASLILDHIAQL